MLPRMHQAAMLAAQPGAGQSPIAHTTLRWPPASDEPRLVTIESFVLIGRPAQAVFSS